MPTPIVSALVTTWSAERFMRGLLEDLEAQTIADQIEVLVIDSASPQNEAAIVHEFQRAYRNIRYFRTDERENSHAALNRAIELARGEFLTVANTDDRHRNDALEKMVGVLQQFPDVGIVYPDTLITRRENDCFDTTNARLRHDWPDYNVPTSLACCLFGAQAMWRRSVHEDVGGYDDRLEIAADHDLYARIGWRYGAVHLRETLGLFLQRADSNSGADNHDAAVREVLQVMRSLRSTIPLADAFPLLRSTQEPTAYAAAWIELGNICACGPYTDGQSALELYQQALAAAGSAISNELRATFANNSACILAAAGLTDRAVSTLDSIQNLAHVEHNLRAIEAARARDVRVSLRDLHFATLSHPVVADARRAHAVTIDSHGRATRTVTERVPWDVFDGPNGVAVSDTELQRFKTGLAREPAASIGQTGATR